MEIKGYIKEIFEQRGGVSARTGNSWKTQSYLLETIEQYPKHLVFDVKNERIDQFALSKGEEIVVSFDIDAHEYKGKWYNGVVAWKIEKTGSSISITRTSTNQAQQPQPVQTAAQPAQQSLYAKAQAAAAQSNNPNIQNLQNQFDAEAAKSDLPF